MTLKQNEEIDLDATLGLPNWYRPNDGLMTGSHSVAARMITAEVAPEFASVSHPARNMLQRWIDASSRVGMNPILLNQLQPRIGEDVYEPMLAISVIVLVLAMRRVAMERRLRIAATLLHENFEIVDLPEELGPPRKAPRDLVQAQT